MRPETKQKQADEKQARRLRRDAGNALIYVLIVIALFGALAFVLSRQRNGNETGQMATQQAATGAMQIIQLSNQIKQGVDQMIYGGTRLEQLNFCLPADGCFVTGDQTAKVFSSDGGGLIPPVLPPASVAQVDENPAPGWYLGAFNNVEWTPTTENDVILTAHQIGRATCAEIDRVLTGSASIPAVNMPLAKLLVDGSRHSQGNAALDKAACPDCDGKSSLCVSNADATMFSFYNVIEQR